MIAYVTVKVAQGHRRRRETTKETAETKKTSSSRLVVAAWGILLAYLCCWDYTDKIKLVISNM